MIGLAEVWERGKGRKTPSLERRRRGSERAQPSRWRQKQKTSPGSGQVVMVDEIDILDRGKRLEEWESQGRKQEKQGLTTGPDSTKEDVRERMRAWRTRRKNGGRKEVSVELSHQRGQSWLGRASLKADVNCTHRQ